MKPALYIVLGLLGTIYLLDILFCNHATKKFLANTEALEKAATSVDLLDASPELFNRKFRCQEHEIGYGYIAKTCFPEKQENGFKIYSPLDSYSETMTFEENVKRGAIALPFYFVPPFRHFAIVREFFVSNPDTKRLFLVNFQNEIVKTYYL